jgi:hypothetical protein
VSIVLYSQRDGSFSPYHFNGTHGNLCSDPGTRLELVPAAYKAAILPVELTWIIVCYAIAHPPGIEPGPSVLEAVRLP